MSTKKLSIILGIIGISLCLMGLLMNERFVLDSGIGILIGDLIGNYCLRYISSKMNIDEQRI